ncbi:S8 family peptidase [Marinobacter sp.]|uniref:S8 family peptidase n=1 Tax=Marinobacter sp. TaxID=50741 RepID=UPI003A94AEFB
MPKNILIGYGETLTKKMPRKFGGGEKSHPYSFTEAKTRLKEQLSQLVLQSRELDQRALYNGNLVAKLTIHPSYLAKSYYPKALLKKFKLTDIGSKPVSIKPRKPATKKQKDKQLLTAAYYIAGTPQQFERIFGALDDAKLENGIRDDVMKIEDLVIYDAQEKIRGDAGENETKYEIALHSPASMGDVSQDFLNYLRLFNGEVRKTRKVGELTFFSAEVPREQLRNVAEFSMLRAIRPMPKVRVMEPQIRRIELPNPSFELPDSDALDTALNVAVFDGGIGTQHLSRWVQEFVYSDESIKNPRYLAHGGEVTSTILFGRKLEDTQLQQPYCNIDHYRVLDPALGEEDDLFDVLDRITEAIKENSYDFINLSLGPSIPIEDDEVHVWTSTLEEILSTGYPLAAVAVGNDGELVGQNRIQPPSDLVNALSVGSSDVSGNGWARAPYSCVGPGRSPGKVKPDGVCFGGSAKEPFSTFSPIQNSIVNVAGTSYATPLALRTCIGIKALLDHPLTPLATKALAIHHAEKDPSLDRAEIGWGRIRESLDDIIFSDDDEATIIYQGEVDPTDVLRAFIPCPPTVNLGLKTQIRATFCFASQVDAEHPIHYTRNGLTLTFHPNSSRTKSFFSMKNIYRTEQEARDDAHKWETCLYHSESCMSEKLDTPFFDIQHGVRERGQAPEAGLNIDPLPYVLVISVRSEGSTDLYSKILETHQTLRPLSLKQNVQIRT